MSENTKIEWCDHTFNPFIGCTKVSPGCDHCYAEAMMDTRLHKVVWGTKERARTSAAAWRKPLKWNAAHAEFFAVHGRRQRVFSASLADVFDNAVDPAWRADLFRLITDTPNLDWLLLTKRIGNVGAMLQDVSARLFSPEPMRPDRLPDNVWLGATIVNQDEADRDLPKLLKVPARVRFLSIEPLLGPVTFRWASWVDHDAVSKRDGKVNHLEGLRGIDWVIAGGESGPGARPMHPQWARSLRDQCAAAGVPFLFKQNGEWAPGSGDFGTGRFETAAIAMDGRVVAGGYDASSYPTGAASVDGWAMVHRAGKTAAGRLLDGRTHDEFPHRASQEEP
ncbi:MAG: phage Gp37/Gp68 family protein [Paraburkholderia sp.]|jgi:protein gp37|nr:phage Gp37/Gp68 family protein [Paraburkholderia sp.]